jgi:integrase
MVLKSEKLPKGFWRSPSGSLRVQIRVTGHAPVVKTFPLHADTSEARQRQRVESDEWAASTRRKLKAGTHVDTREAEKMTLGEALEKYERLGLKGKDSNIQKDRNRIKQILSDPIAKRAIASLRKTDIAAYRDELIQRGWVKNIELAIVQLTGSPENRERIADLKSLKSLRQKSEKAANFGEQRLIETQIDVIQRRENVNIPARTTITNKLQLITRALKFIGQTIDGVPDLTGVPVALSSESRDRRLTGEEYKRLINAAAPISATLPLIVRFAKATALRRERILDFRLRNIRDIGDGKRAIVFPRDSQVRNKRTGIIPITQELQTIINDASELYKTQNTTIDDNEPLFDMKGPTLDHQWRKAVINSEIEDFHFHDLRHEATSLLFERGLTTAEVMSITGHSTNDMVDRYSHYSASLVHDKLEKGLNPEAILSEITFLAKQYKALAGDLSGLISAVSSL